ncbi:MAG TPA: hypothetical protein G4O04_01135 [Anaerolineae bacterium]|nr:hypothetical protein [Anaerolineae bacterium]HID85027.1 hypothetical protein [Anaerolineales bacterium]HIQ08179.1 hypothetical protein [Anaerolineaceae bacterium]
MPSELFWHPDLLQVLVMKFSGAVSLDEALDRTVEEGEFIKQADTKVHTIIDLREVTGVPNDFLSVVPRIGTMPAASHPNAGYKVVVGARGLAKVFLDIFSNVVRRLIMVDTMEEAEAFLREKLEEGGEQA